MSSPHRAGRSSPQVTELLTAWRAGDRSALDELLPLIETDLRRLAYGYLRRERSGHVLQPTALVNEAFVRLLNWQSVSWQNRAHFLAMAARIMRNILVDLSRRRAGVLLVDLEAAGAVMHDRSRDLVALDDALQELAEHDPRKAQIVELRFYGGLNLAEIADVIGVAPITVSREWAKARAWLHREIAETPEHSPRR